MGNIPCCISDFIKENMPRDDIFCLNCYPDLLGLLTR